MKAASAAAASVGVTPLVGAGRGCKVGLLHVPLGGQEHLVRPVLLPAIGVDALQRTHLRKRSAVVSMHHVRKTTCPSTFMQANAPAGHP